MADVIKQVGNLRGLADSVDERKAREDRFESRLEREEQRLASRLVDPLARLSRIARGG